MRSLCGRNNRQLIAFIYSEFIMGIFHFLIVVQAIVAASLVGVILMLFGAAKTVNMYYFFCVWLGLGTGYWALFVTMGAEQFGTNIRATAATTIPNMVRGALILMIFLFNSFKPSVGVIWAAVVVGVLSFGFGIYSTMTVAETHNKDLDYTE